MPTQWTNSVGPGSRILALDVTEIRTAVNSNRSAAGLPSFTWTDNPLQAGVSRIKAVHFTEARQAIVDLWNYGGMSPLPVWTSEVTPGGLSTGTAATRILASHLTDLRNWLNQYEYRRGIRGYHLMNSAWVKFDVVPDPNAPKGSPEWLLWAFYDDIDKLNYGYSNAYKLIVYSYIEQGNYRQYWRDQQKTRIKKLNLNGPSQTMVLRLNMGPEFTPDLNNPYASGQNFANDYVPILQDVASSVISGTNIRVEVHNEPNLTDEKFNADATKFNPFFEWCVDRLRQQGLNLPFGYPGLSPGVTADAQADGWLQYSGTLNTINNKADWVGVHCYWPTGYWDDDAVSGHLDRGRWYRMVRQILHDGGVPDSMPLIITEYANGDELGVCDQTCKGTEYKNWLDQVWADRNNYGVQQTAAFITQPPGTDFEKYVLERTALALMRQGGGEF